MICVTSKLLAQRKIAFTRNHPGTSYQVTQGNDQAS
jgi:hypothetical protein